MLSNNFFHEFTHETDRDEKASLFRMTKKKHIYNIVRARKRDPKGAQKKQNEKRKKFCAKRLFSPKKAAD